MFHRTINPAGHLGKSDGHHTGNRGVSRRSPRRHRQGERIDLDSAAEELGKPSLGRMIRAAPRMLTRAGHGSLPLFFASATGMFDGRAMRVVARIADDSPVSVVACRTWPGALPESPWRSALLRWCPGSPTERFRIGSVCTHQRASSTPEVLFTALARLFDRTDWSEIVTVESEFR